MKYYCLLLSFLWGFVFFVSGQERISVCNLRCEYLEDPVAVENEKPLLSWQLQSSGQAKSQTAYRILVASSPSLLAEGKADFWDSGKITSSRSSQVGYEGKPLDSRQTLYWKAMVWDEAGEASPWSETGRWTMGLLESSDWTARWIGNREDAYPDSTLTTPAPYFRKTFRINKPVKQAKAYICGLGFYEMYLNGERVGDQVLAPAVTNFDRRSLKKMLYFFDDQSNQRVLYNTFDVTSLVQKAENTVGVLLGNGWYNQRDRTVEGCMWYDTPRLLCQLEIEYTDGSTELVVTDDSWKTTTGPLLHDAIFTGEEYDARLELDGWNRLSTEELEEVNRLYKRKEAMSAAGDEERTDRIFKLKCFMLFLGLKIVRRTVTDENGETVFLFRRRGIRHLFERIPMRAWQVDQWIDQKLGFLENPFARTVTPYGIIRLRMGTLRLKAPKDVMSDVSFAQYQSAQNLLIMYWDAQKVLQTLVRRKSTHAAIRMQLRRMKQERCRFLATLFNESVRETGEIREGRYLRKCKRRVWSFNSGQIQKNARWFSMVEARMFPVMVQYFQSVQEAYARMYPELFTPNGKKNGRQNPIKIEVEMINNIMKYQGFSDYDAVYDSEAVRILGIMNAMAKEAKEIEKMNQKYRKGK